jgi:hypothetical protein
MMAARPQTLYGIADSPVGLAAWLLDHNDADAQPAAAVASALERTESATGELTRDEVLDNITLYWLTNTGVSASRLYPNLIYSTRSTRAATSPPGRSPSSSPRRSERRSGGFDSGCMVFFCHANRH